MPYDVGTLRMIDYTISVGRTGIRFVTALNGYLTDSGSAVIAPLEIEWANHRAASQLAFMGLIRGDVFGFMRNSVPMSVTDAAILTGYTADDVNAWEAQDIPLPAGVWEAMSDYCCTLDNRGAPHAAQIEPNFRPRLIRIVTNVPQISSGTAVTLPTPYCPVI